MNLLLAEFTIVFVFAALCGFVIGRWSVRRKFVDVTESYETISKAAAGDVPWDMLWARFDSLDVNVRLIVREELDARLNRDEAAQ
ncbi:MAG: hypothetical protein PVF63_02805 [Gammaproteobacteria bacterium]|jgi:hypothetical protein